MGKNGNELKSILDLNQRRRVCVWGQKKKTGSGLYLERIPYLHDPEQENRRLSKHESLTSSHGFKTQ